MWEESSELISGLSEVFVYLFNFLFGFWVFDLIVFYLVLFYLFSFRMMGILVSGGFFYDFIYLYFVLIYRVVEVIYRNYSLIIFFLFIKISIRKNIN